MLARSRSVPDCGARKLTPGAHGVPSNDRGAAVCAPRGRGRPARRLRPPPSAATPFRRSGRRSGGCGRLGARQQYGTYAFLPPTGGLDHPGHPRRRCAQSAVHRWSQLPPGGHFRCARPAAHQPRSTRSSSRTRSRRSSSTWPRRPSSVTPTTDKIEAQFPYQAGDAGLERGPGGQGGQPGHRPGRRQGVVRQHLGEPAGQPAADRAAGAPAAVLHVADAGRRLPGAQLRQVQGEDDHQGHAEDDVRGRGRAPRRRSRSCTRSRTSCRTRRSTRRWAPRSRRACCSSARPAPVRRCWPAPSPARPGCRSTRSPAPTSWRCSSVSAPAGSATCSSRPRRTPRRSSSSTRSTPSAGTAAPAWAAATTSASRRSTSCSSRWTASTPRAGSS